MVICWWSGGVTSAVACKVALDLYGKDNCRVIMIDTKNEDDDTYRFLVDCEKWYGKQIEIITAIGSEYESIQDVWIKHRSLNVANGAICSSKLKRAVREKWQKTNEYTSQVFGFEFDKKEFNRAMSMQMNHEKAKPIFPLLMMGYDKLECIRVLENAKIDIPRAYKMGLKNNNCLNTGCVQGGIGYWQKIQKEMPDRFDAMADMEHKLTDLKGKPVTMLKDQSKKARESGNVLVFLKKHKDYPELKCIDDMEKMEVKPLFECNGFCGINDINNKSETENEINFTD